MKFRWFSDRDYQPMLIVYVGGSAKVRIRFGLETRPLFSERNQEAYGIPRRWFYFFGKRLSIWINRG